MGPRLRDGRPAVGPAWTRAGAGRLSPPGAAQPLPGRLRLRLRPARRWRSPMHPPCGPQPGACPDLPWIRRRPEIEERPGLPGILCQRVQPALPEGEPAAARAQRVLAATGLISGGAAARMREWGLGCGWLRLSQGGARGRGGSGAPWMRGLALACLPGAPASACPYFFCVRRHFFRRPWLQDVPWYAVLGNHGGCFAALRGSAPAHPCRVRRPSEPVHGCVQVFGLLCSCWLVLWPHYTTHPPCHPPTHPQLTHLPTHPTRPLPPHPPRLWQRGQPPQGHRLRRKRPGIMPSRLLLHIRLGGARAGSRPASHSPPPPLSGGRP